MQAPNTDVPFTFLCSLFREVAQVENRPAKHAHPKGKQGESLALQIFKRWLTALHSKFGPLPSHSTAAILRLMFPEEDAKRRYMMQESRLIQKLSQCYGVDPSRFNEWDKFEGSGCLGDEIRVVLEKSNSRAPDYIGPLSILQVDRLLTELASLCAFSDGSIRSAKSSRTQTDIIRDLYRDMSPEDASYLTQIILRDLRPLLYPLPSMHPTAALIHFNTRAVSKLNKVEVLRAWDFSMLKAYRVQADFDRAAGGLASEPELGVVIQIPKSQKGQSCKHSLDFFRSCRRVWAETKYDGERAQIHVTMQSGQPRIKIFSKSKRDSTLDRKGVHDVIVQALGDKVRENVILDAEMVAFNGDCNFGESVILSTQLRKVFATIGPNRVVKSVLKDP
ncbi:hypothetical protein NMY22_g19553 [Coprinellus aureogranulatus]|nr:hypothetical protein NMY22_g19553 [Coprinellus aureogranulatus]